MTSDKIIGLKLYRVTIEYDVYAIGKDERDAIFAAQEDIRDEGYDPDSTDAFEVTRVNAKQIPPAWLSCAPFGSDDTWDRPLVSEWVDALPALDVTPPLPFGGVA